MNYEAAVYHIFGIDGCLYVGMTTRGQTRIREHAHKHWWGDAVGVVWEHFDDHEQASRRERELIRELAPAHNRAHAGAGKATGGILPMSDPSNTMEAVQFAASGLRYHTAERDRLVVEALREGGSLREVAEAVGLSHAAIARIRDRTDPSN